MAGSKNKKQKNNSGKTKEKNKPTKKKPRAPKPVAPPVVLTEAAAVAASGASFVVRMSNDGPYAVTQVTVDDRDLLTTAIMATEPETSVDISSVFHPGARIAWRIVGAIQFPKAATILRRPGTADQVLKTKAPLKKNVAWADEKVI